MATRSSPSWWNWETRQLQVLVLETGCGFESHGGHHRNTIEQQSFCPSGGIGRRASLRSWSRKRGVGSSPTEGTILLLQHALVLELVDRPDSESGGRRPWGFESPRGHQQGLAFDEWGRTQTRRRTRRRLQESLSAAEHPMLCLSLGLGLVNLVIQELFGLLHCLGRFLEKHYIA